MPIQKKRDHQTESRLLLVSADPIELPPAEVAETAALLTAQERTKVFGEALSRPVPAWLG